jgi:alkylation response protein AidB-like acyl-CoA dehydrogenase
VRFSLTADQLALREAVRDLLARECPPGAVRDAWPGGDRAAATGAWRHLAEMGVLAAALPEHAGGLGLGHADLVPLLEEAGHAGLPMPLTETAFVAAPLLAAAGDPGERLPALADGDLVIACDLAGDGTVPYGAIADVMLLGDGERVRWVTAEQVRREAVEAVDGARALVRVGADAATAGVPLTDDASLVAAALDRGALGAAAELIGLSRRMLEMTTDYVQERRQFGVAVGSFQAVKHHLADALLAVEFAAPAVLRAAWSLDVGAQTAARDVSMAKALASDAGELVADVALQCHGAIAYTVEYDLHLYAKRSWALARRWGSAEQHRARIEQWLELSPMTTGG